MRLRRLGEGVAGEGALEAFQGPAGLVWYTDGLPIWGQGELLVVVAPGGVALALAGEWGVPLRIEDGAPLPRKRVLGPVVRVHSPWGSGPGGMEGVLVAGERGIALHPTARLGEKRIAPGDWVLVRFGAAPEEGAVGVVWDGQSLVLTREAEGRPWLGRVVWRAG